MLTAALGVLAVIVLTAATGYFVAQEFAYVAADRATLEQAAERGDASAGRALKVIGRLSFMLSGAQLGITMTTLVVGFIAKPALAELIQPMLEVAGIPEGATGAIALAAGFVLATLIQMLLGELFPKNLALARAEPLARALARSTLIYLAVAGPLIRLFDGSAERLLRAVGVEPVQELHGGATLEELGDIIGKSHSAGHLPADLSGLLDRALSFGDLTADAVMVPRPQVRTLPGSAPVSELVALIRETGHSAYPVYGQEVDDVIGVAGVREVADDALDPATPVREVARPALLVPGSQPLYGVIEHMRDSGEEFACVVDEYGGLAGILTFEDVAEELVGEIADETDAREDAPTSGPDGSWIVDAGMRIDEVGRLTRFDLPEGDAYDTLGGLVMAELRRLPSPGDRLTVELDTGSVELEVLSVARRVADKILIKAPSPVEVAGPPVVPAPSRADVPAPAGDVAAPSAGQDAAAPGQEVSWTR
ncbi:CBS domain containing-hemolysin-like protein [Actinomadura hallensis]|uniref:CBS domain containing-hemolysin-like protein n=1 Tax=Actinomadura hallensis TaxID=337895 RepID=A0A543I7J8_9ACTN|nr:hemolysin family protein [Actinomadura hallensis]TQM66529.1 CBS domain containing-hemolysin-like protein [Actinomadura hallensis]HLV73518.1 hemolysin family protein [Vulgatibacteraceae bacterium]